MAERKPYKDWKDAKSTIMEDPIYSFTTNEAFCVWMLEGHNLNNLTTNEKANKIMIGVSMIAESPDATVGEIRTALISLGRKGLIQEN